MCRDKLPICTSPRGSIGGQAAGRGLAGCRALETRPLMGNRVLSIAQIALLTTAERWQASRRAGVQKRGMI